MKTNKEILTKIEFMIKLREMHPSIRWDKTELDLLKELKEWCLK